MSPPIWAGLILLGLGALWLLARLMVGLPPRRALALGVLAAAAGLAAYRIVAVAVPLAVIGLGLWRSTGAIPSPGGESEVESPGLRMTLDHDSGRMDGEVTTGPLQGALLSELSAEDLDRLAAAFEAEGDDDSLALLLAWLERHGPRRRGTAPPPAEGPGMTEAEAFRILGLAPGASIEEVRAAYNRLIRRVHPDLGGTSALAALLNAAKETLDPG